MKSRSRSISTKLISLLALPLLSLIVLWAIAAGVTFTEGLSLLRVIDHSDDLGFPSQALIRELQTERQESVVSVASGAASRGTLAAQRSRTDAALASFRTKALSDKLTGPLASRTNAALAATANLTRQRAEIDSGTSSRLSVADYYTGVIARLAALIDAIQPADHVPAHLDGQGLIELNLAVEVRSQVAAIVSGALAAGRFQGDEYTRVVGLVSTQRYLYAQGLGKLDSSEQQPFTALSASSTGRLVQTMENTLLAQGRSGSRPPVDENAWNTATDRLSRQTEEVTTSTASRLADGARPGAIWIIVRLAVAGVLGLVAVVISILISIRIGRSLARELVGVRRSALGLAVNELPAIVRRLRDGEDVDVTAEVQPLTGFTIREIAGVAEAMDAARSTAVEVAVEEAQLRRGVREVFLNLARRSQTLVHRQLTLLDAMERREKDPEELDDLFQLDHLATRMRCHAEDLIVLSGSTPGRGWRNPVPLVDVMRGAVAEVEDYARVRVVGATRSSLAGRGVSDVIHLLAELIENATTFSPPHTTVHVSGELVPAGFAIEIEDRGLGMPPEQLAAVNAKLAEPPEFDLMHSERLGLFVVGQLAARHDIHVVLRGSPFGGTTAIVLLPTVMVMTPEASGTRRTNTAELATLSSEDIAAATAAPRALAIAPDLTSSEREAEVPEVAAPAPVTPSRPFQPSGWSESPPLEPSAADDAEPDPVEPTPDTVPDATEPPTLPFRNTSQYGPYRPATYSLRMAERHRAAAGRPAPPANGAVDEAGSGTEPLPKRRAPVTSDADQALTSTPDALASSPASAPRVEEAAAEQPVDSTPASAEAPVSWPEPVPAWPEPVPAWPEPEAAEAGVREPVDSPPVPLARREPGAGWEHLSNRAPTGTGEALDARPRGVARPPLASRGIPETGPDATPIGAGPADAGTETGPEFPEPAPVTATSGGLPRRVRQASLAAPLRAAPPASVTSPEPTSMRSPEEVRGLMASYQRGTALGRNDAARTIGRAGPALSPMDDPTPGTDSDHGRESTYHSEPQSDEVSAGLGSLDGTREGER